MNDDALALQRLTEDIVRAKADWTYAPTDLTEQVRWVATAFDHALDDNERFVIDYYYGLGGERLTLARIEVLEGWKRSHASAARQRSLGKLYTCARPHNVQTFTAHLR